MKKYLPYLSIITAAFLWSIDAYIRQSLFLLSPLLIITIEHGMGSIIFLPSIIKNWNKIINITRKGWLSILGVSFLGGVLGTYFYTKALGYTGYIELSIVVLLQKFQPLFAISLATIILKEKITKRFIILSIIAVIGGYLVTFGLNPIKLWNNNNMVAAFYAILAALCWGSSTVLGKYILKTLSFSLVTALRLLLTTIFGIIIIISIKINLLYSTISSQQWQAIFLIVFTTGTLALFIYYYGLKNIPASHATIFELFWPLSAVLIDWIINEKTLSVMQLTGAIMLLGSMTILSNEKTNEKI
jgi:drug/metabolite transporter (DMT)-like permease